jgi:DNA helicase-2/ATP-dependent DNA helicase PcrA
MVDGCIPSDMATGTPEELEEERRLLYVALTRARDHLHLVYPHRFYTRRRPDRDNHIYAPRTRFIPDALLPLFERRGHGTRRATDSLDLPIAAPIDVQTRIRERWG